MLLVLSYIHGERNLSVLWTNISLFEFRQSMRLNVGHGSRAV
jgi:hypothetical protein